MGHQPAEYDIESATLPEQPVLVVHATVGQAQFGTFLGDAFAHVSEVAVGDGMSLSGPPFARIRPQSGDTFAVEAGFPVSGMLLGQGDVKASHLPGGTVLQTIHRGGYAEVRAAHEALHAFAARQGLTAAGDAWEVYLDEPDVARPRTLVVLPVRRGSDPAHVASGSVEVKETIEQ